MSTVTDAKWKLGDRLTKTKGSSWTGHVVGFYSTSLTPIGYAIESENEPGSVQIYPESALTEAAEAVRVKGVEPSSTVPIIPHGFIPWPGGECPVAEGAVGEIIVRRGKRIGGSNYDLASLEWRHGAGSLPTSEDIIAYRIHTPADFRLEAGKYYITASGERVGPMKPLRATGLFVAKGFEDDRCHRASSVSGRVVPAWDIAKHDLLALAADQGESHD